MLSAHFSVQGRSPCPKSGIVDSIAHCGSDDEVQHAHRSEERYDFQGCPKDGDSGQLRLEFAQYVGQVVPLLLSSLATLVRGGGECIPHCIGVSQ